MNKIETTYKIGDLVYTANRHGIDREVIKAIKVIGLKEEVRYGFSESSSSSLFSFYWSNGDGYKWFASSQVYKTKEEADKLHKSLKAKEEAKERKEKLDNYDKRKAQLEKELKELSPENAEYDDWEDD